MGKAREINKINCALTMCMSLITTYKDIQKANDSIYVSKSSQAFTDLKVCGAWSLYFKLVLIWIDIYRNWQKDLHFRSVWMPWRIVKPSFRCIELAFYLLYKITTMQSMIRPHHHRVSYFWKFSMNSPTNYWNRTRKLCKFRLSHHKNEMNNKITKTFQIQVEFLGSAHFIRNPIKSRWRLATVA